MALPVALVFACSGDGLVGFQLLSQAVGEFFLVVRQVVAEVGAGVFENVGGACLRGGVRGFAP